MSLVIDVLCRDGIIVGCDSKVTVSVSDNKFNGYTNKIYPKIYNGGYFLLATVGNKKCYNKDNDEVYLYDIGEALKELNTDIRNLPYDFNEVLNSLCFNKKMVALYYYIDGRPIKYVFDSRETTEICSYAKDFKEDFHSYGSLTKLSERLLDLIKRQKEYVSYSQVLLSDVIPIVKAVFDTTINIAELSADRNVLGHPVLIYAIDNNGFVKEFYNDFYQYKEETVVN